MAVRQIVAQVTELSTEAPLRGDGREGAPTVVRFDDGSVATTSRQSSQGAAFEAVLQTLRVHRLPVYAEVEDESGTIQRLLVPVLATVLRLGPKSNGDLVVELSPVAALHSLSRSNPRFAELTQVLQESRDTKAVMLVTQMMIMRL